MEKKSITILLSVIGVLLAALLIFNFTNIGSVNAQTNNDTDVDKTITVYGKGMITINPDIASITFGFENTDKDPKKAQDENKKQMEKIINAVKRAGVKDSQMKTVRYRVSQKYNSSYFLVNNMVQVETDDIEKTSDIIKAAYDAGANEFWDVRFDIIKRQEAYLDALELAMQRARQKADKLAVLEQKTVAEVLSIEEGTERNSYFFSSPYTNYISASSSSGGYSDGSISSGEMEVSAVVNVIYRLN